MKLISERFGDENDQRTEFAHNSLLELKLVCLRYFSLLLWMVDGGACIIIISDNRKTKIDKIYRENQSLIHRGRQNIVLMSASAGIPVPQVGKPLK